MSIESDFSVSVNKLVNLSKIDIYSQPIVNLLNLTKNSKHFEILSRFYDDKNNFISPDDIFGVRQTYDTLFNLDKIIFEKTIDKIVKYNNILGDDFIACVNVSSGSLDNVDTYFHFIDNIFDKYNLNSKNFDLEITEKGSHNLEDFIGKALERKFSISIDDFGTEDFSVGKLRNEILPNFNSDEKSSKLTIKIDKSFLFRLTEKDYIERPMDISLIEMVYSIKKSYPKIKLVAEGIESFDVLEEILKLGNNYGISLDFGQGYLWSKPELFKEEYKQPYLTNNK